MGSAMCTCIKNERTQRVKPSAADEKRKTWDKWQTFYCFGRKRTILLQCAQTSPARPPIRLERFEVDAWDKGRGILIFWINVELHNFEKNLRFWQQRGIVLINGNRDDSKRSKLVPHRKRSTSITKTNSLRLLRQIIGMLSLGISCDYEE
jgi:hypothetical protein